ncbi:type IV pilus secretin PilQ [Thiofaba sp. EF100]|uniref:type IV pilus secretin PilQ n=1 Tax=Thiofaba sp. EF100 TaxID=3121274 RepID=UPI0032216099
MKKPTLYQHPLARTMALALGLGLNAAWAENVIQDMNVVNTPDGSMQIRFTMAEPPKAAPTHFSIEQPARIALDFQDTKLGLDKRFQAIESGAVNDVRFAEAGGRTRAVISLKGYTAYDVKTEGQAIILTLRPDHRPANMEAASPQPQADTIDTAEVDFRRGSQGEGRLIVNLARPNVPMTMKAEGRRLIVDLPQTRLTAQQYDVADFATPVSKVSVQPQGTGSRLVIDTSAPFDKLAYQADNQLTVEVRPLPKEQPATAAGLGPKEYKGERLTLKFQDIEIRPLLQLLADFTGNNIVVSDSVQGRMSLRLENVPWDQAMDLILTTKGLSQRKNGNVIFVAPTAEIAAREKAEMEARKQTEDLTPLVSEFMQVNYAKAADIARLLNPYYRPAGATGAPMPAPVPTGTTAAARPLGFLSPRGTLTVDERTNTLLINDTPESLDKIRDLVKKLDTPIKQVLIESRIVIATDDFSRELGLKWGVTGAFNGSGDPVFLSGNATGTTGMVNNYASGNAPGVPALDNRFNVNMPAGNFTSKPVTGGLGLAVLGSNVLVDLELQALQVEGKGEIVSSPRVITANGQKAVIKQGKEIPYLQQTSSGATNIAFKEAVLATDVTPQITPNNNVIMEIKVQKDEPDWTRSVNGVPPIDKREVETKVQVKNGETVVLGGIYEISSADQIQKIPFLGDLPILGNLFKTNGTKNNKFELIIFVTPRIVENGVMVTSNN